MNNNDMSKMLEVLSKMDKKDLEAGMSKVSQILNSNDKDKIIDTLKKGM